MDWRLKILPDSTGSLLATPDCEGQFDAKIKAQGKLRDNCRYSTEHRKYMVRVLPRRSIDDLDHGAPFLGVSRAHVEE